MLSSPRFSQVVSVTSLCALLLAGATTTAHTQRISSIGLVGQATFDSSNPIKVSKRANGADATTTVGGLSGITRDAARRILRDQRRPGRRRSDPKRLRPARREY